MPNGDKSVGIVGLGHVGIETIKALWPVDEISNFYFFTGDAEDKGMLWVDKTIHSSGKTASAADYDFLHNFMEDLDIIIITSDESDYRNKVASDFKREDLISANISLSQRLSDQFLKRKYPNWEGTIVPITNQVDIFTQLLWDQSGIIPERFAGMNHLLQITWEEMVYNIYRDLNADEELLDMIKTAVLGPHSEYAVPLFLGLGGMSRTLAPFVQNDENYKKIKVKAKEWSKTQFELGMKYGLVTEAETANAIVKVVQAVFDEESTVTASVLLKPSEMGFESDKTGLFSGWRTKFKNGLAIPQFDFKIEEDSDLDALAIAGQWQEQILIQLEKEKAIKDYPTRTINLGDYGLKKEEKEFQRTIKIRKLFPTDFSVVAATENKIFKWDNLNKIVDPEVSVLERMVHCFTVDYIGKDVKYLIGHEEGLSIIDPISSKEEIIFPKEVVGSVRKVETHKINGKQYLFGADRESGFMFDLEKPGKGPIEFKGFYDSLNDFIVRKVNGNIQLLVAAYGIHPFNLENPEEPLPMFGNENFTDLDINRNRLYGSSENMIQSWNMDLATNYTDTLTKLPKGVNSFRFVDIFGIDKIFASTNGPVIYQLSEEGKLEATFRKENGNLYGTEKMKILPFDGINYLLAADLSKQHEKRATGVTIWNLAYAPEKPLRFLSTYQNHRIRGFGFLE